MRLKLTQVFCFALAASSTLARLQGYHRRHGHGNHNPLEELSDQHVEKRDLINVDGAVGIGPLTATVGLEVGPAGHPHPHGEPHNDPHGGPHDHPHGHGHGHGGPPGHEHGGPPGHPHDSPGQHPVKPTAVWDQIPPDGKFSFDGFGKRTQPHGDGVSYVGNIGDPWGSNIITLKDASAASSHKYVAQIHGSKDRNAKPWTVVFWNKIGPDGKMTGWYGHSALRFTIAANEVIYVAFDENSQGGFAAAPGDKIPTDQWGGYSATWGEWDFGDTKNGGLSGWDVSCIQAQNAKQVAQGMRMCLSNMDKCSTITRDAKLVENAYDSAKEGVDGLGGTVGAGAVRLIVELDFAG